MSPTKPPSHLLSEIETRQEEVLRQLDELDQRIQRTLLDLGAEQSVSADRE